MLSQNKKSPVIDSVEDFEELKKLVLSAKKGDKEAFGQVYTKLFTPLYRYTLSRCYSVELAEDICQQTFLKFYGALDSYEPNKTPLAYLFTIAKRLLINESKKQSTIEIDEKLLEAQGDDSIDILGDAHISQLADKINDILPSLTEDEQEVIRLFYYAERDYKEISVILEKKEEYIRKIKERALKKLRYLTTNLNEQN